jgi:hypothetical protein
LAPGSNAATTIRSFSDLDQRRRRCTDVITSTDFVIELALVIVLGLAKKTHLGKAALTGRLRPVCRVREDAVAARQRKVDEIMAEVRAAPIPKPRPSTSRRMH